MGAPYRGASGPCPACASPLREFERRSVCDRCQGMLIGDADLAEALGASEEDRRVEARDVERTTTACPRCGQPMERCGLRLGGHALAEPALRCPTDGVWLTQDQLVAELARSNRRGSGGGGGGTAVAEALVSTSPSGSGAAALQGIGRAFSQNQRLPIGYRPPRVRAAFVSAFAGHELGCPACAEHPALRFAGDRWACDRCAGTFVEDAALIAMVSDIRAAPWPLPAPRGAAGERACPVCAAAMTTEQAGSIELDRCAGHGLWFDADELGAALLHESGQDEPAPDAPAGGVLGWLKRLFA